jgi:hypothetical protein
MDWGTVVGLLIAIPFAIMFGLCALMMLRMVIGGALGGSGYGGHGMMCMGHGHGAHVSPRGTDEGLLEELKAERKRLGALIDKAERSASGRAR